MNIITQITAALGAVKGLVQAGKDLYAAYGHGRWVKAVKASKTKKGK